jgi:hypothetical protein
MDRERGWWQAETRKHEVKMVMEACRIVQVVRIAVSRKEGQHVRDKSRKK